MKLVYVMDPMCSWCWAFSPALQHVLSQHPSLDVHYIMGGLAPDSDQPMPTAQREQIEAIWHTISDKTGTTFNHDFWRQCEPRRSTHPACRAVISAEQLKPGSAAKMINAIQHAYYLQAQNPSDEDTLIAAAESIDLDRTTFQDTLRSAQTEAQLQQHFQIAHTLQASGFPSVYVSKSTGECIPVSQGYCDADTLQQRVQAALDSLQQ